MTHDESATPSAGTPLPGEHEHAHPHQHEHEHDDGPLESVGKAIVDPVVTAADDEEPRADGVPSVRPGG